MEIKLTDELRQKVLSEYKHWYDANRSKNELFDSQKDIYSTKKDSELLRSKLFWSIMRTIQATCIINQPIVTWEDEDNLFQQEARNFSKMYEYDFLNNQRWFDEYIGIEDVCKYWKYVRLFTGWDNDEKVPEFERIDPRFVYPYNDGSLKVKKYPFFGFDRVISVDDIDQLWLAKERVERVIHNYDEYINWLKTVSAFYRNISTFYDKWTWQITIHYHYTKIKKKYYLVQMIGWVIIDIKDIPETQWKRIPIAVTWFAYDSSDRWWESLVNIIEDSHRTEQLLLNLYKIKVTREATGWNIFIDEEIFMKNINSLKNQSIKNRWFPVKMRDLTKPISSMVYELPQSQVSPDIYNSLTMVKNKAMSESFANAAAQWLGLSENSNPNTATASKIQKINANMMTTLQNQILAYGSYDFAYLYREFVLYRWRDSSKKAARNITNWLSWTYKKLTKKDIRWNFNIVLEDPIIKQINDEEQIKAYTEQYNMLVNDPQTPRFLLNNIRKTLCYLKGMDENQIDSSNELDLEELQCKQDVLLLNQDQNIYIPVNANVQMRLWYYNKAKDTKAKDNAITALKYMAARKIGTTPQVWWDMQQMQPQMWGWFPWQDQMMQQQAPAPRAQQPKVENPITKAEAENKALSVNGMDTIQ